MARSCEQALALGVPAVAFTDHLDFTDWIDGDQIGTLHLDPHRYARMHLLDVTGYLATVAEWEDRWQKLAIKITDAAMKRRNDGDSGAEPPEPAESATAIETPSLGSAFARTPEPDAGEVYVITSARPRQPGW